MKIIEGGLDDPRVIALLEKHEAINLAQSPPESCHTFNLSRLKGDDIFFWSVWEGDALLGVGALKRIDAGHGEVKSMHTAEGARGRGVGGAMLETIIAAAKDKGMTRLSLETGSMAYFAPAHALYRKHGFIECPPFDGYVEDPLSLFMTREVAQ